MFRAGDAVLHRPSGETWILACDERNGEIVCCGWPESMAPAKDCDLVEAATDRMRSDILWQVARECRDELRARRARQDLADDKARTADHGKEG